MKKSSCPLDCYDACGVVYEDGKLKGDLTHPISEGSLCSKLNSFLSEPRVTKPLYNGKEISMDEALEILSKKIQSSKNGIYFKGSGNFGVMQNITKEFFAKRDFTFTSGSLCDSAGEAGVKSGRGESLSVSFDDLKKSEVVVLWGRNIDTTSPHIKKHLEQKTLIVIDPVKTKAAKRANLHIQIEPNKDIKLAILLARFVIIGMHEDREFIENRSEDFDYFVDFINSFGIKKLMSELNISASELNSLVDYITSKKVVFLIGVGVQKYKNGASVLWMIDSLGALLGLFGKEGCGVGYLSNSSFGFELPFSNQASTTPIVNVDFSKYDLAFIQGANPANQMPNSAFVEEGLKECEFVVYFGLYENETSKLADLVIPAKSFLAKDDIRFSYAHEYVGLMPKIVDEDIGISEYDLTSNLLEKFGYEKLDHSKKIIDKILSQNITKDGEYFKNSTYDKIAYEDEFYSDSGDFLFIDEIEEEDEDEEEDSSGFYLITSKSTHSLNSQYKRDNYLYIHPKVGFREGEVVQVSNMVGSYRFEVKHSLDLREDCVLIHSGARGVNYLTSNELSTDGKGAIYQDIKVQIHKMIVSKNSED